MNRPVTKAAAAEASPNGAGFEPFRHLLDSLPSAMLVIRDGRNLYFNERFRTLTGYKRSDLARAEPLSLVHPDDRPLVAEGRSALDGRPFEYRLLTRSGRARWVLETASPCRPAGPGSLAATIIDVSGRKRADADLQYALTLYAATLESTTDGILVVDTRGVIRHMNRRLQVMWRLPPGHGYLGKEGRPLMQKMLALVSDREGFLGIARRAHYNGERVGEVVELVDGRVLEVHTSPQIIDGVIAGQVWSFRDVTEREHLQENLQKLASFDSLTGIPGRRSFQEAVTQAIARGEHGAVLFMDVDDFKTINDSLGHSAGDEFLRNLAQSLSAGLRHQDFMARLGGDEFAVLLLGANRREATAVAQRMLKSVREMKSMSADQPIASTLSIGAALFPLHGSSVDELLGHADMAMYQAKRGGRNSFRIYQAAHGSRQSSMSRVLWKQKIAEALENDRFVLHAQPIFELHSGRLGCYELLLRLRETNGRLIHPTKFLTAAEQSGLIKEIDAWVVRQSFDIVRRLLDSPRPVKVAFNLSASSVGNDALLDVIKREAGRVSLPKGSVTVEVTETALIGDIQKARAFFASLKDLGFKISLDDFGAGFSSFSRLKQVPADYLKIDGSFIQNITHNERDRHFVRAIADLASGLGIGAVAECVEEEAAVDLLIELGVLNGQGFYLGRPRPVNRILEEHFSAQQRAA